MPEQTAKEVADKLIAHLKKGKEVHDIFAEQFKKRYTLSGKTVEQWESHFKLTVPDNPDPETCKGLDMTIMGLHQEAAFYHAEASAYAQAAKKGSETEYRNRYAALVTEYKQDNKKMPSQKALEDLVRFETDEVESAVTNAEIQMEFWNNIMSHLNMCRRLLENATINSGIQTKMELGHRGNIYDTPNAAGTERNERNW